MKVTYSTKPEGADDLYIVHRLRCKERWDRAWALHASHEHPAVIAATARLSYYLGAWPQLGLVNPATVAWYRESRTRSGYLNRSERRAISRKATLSPSPACVPQ